METDWWQSHALAPGIHVTGVPAQHWTSRGLFDRNRTLWLGYVLETPGGDVFFAGDTGFGPHFAAIAARFPDLRLALLPIGAYLPRWFMKPVHMNPGEAVAAWRTLGAEYALGIHYGTFRLAEEGQQQPIADLAAALSMPDAPSAIAGSGDATRVPTQFSGNPGAHADCFRTPPFGQAWDVPARCERTMLAASQRPITTVGFADP